MELSANEQQYLTDRLSDLALGLTELDDRIGSDEDAARRSLSRARKAFNSVVERLAPEANLFVPQEDIATYEED